MPRTNLNEAFDEHPVGAAPPAPALKGPETLGDHREAIGALLRQLASDTGCRSTLVEFGPTPSSGVRILAGDRLREAQALAAHPDVLAVRAGHRDMAVFPATGPLALSGGVLLVAAADRQPCRHVLVMRCAAGPGPAQREAAELAARLLAVCLRARRTEISDLRLRQTRTRVREVAFRLLCAGQSAAARQVAASLGGDLPDPVRVCVLEGIPRSLRDRHRSHPEQALGAQVWAFRATAQRDTVVLLAPAHDRAALNRLLGILTAHEGCHAAVSEAVPLRETGSAFESALQALYAARAGGASAGGSGSRARLALILGPDAITWAGSLLAPLLAYAPPRRGAADADELLCTVRAWLRLGPHGARNLGLHRNTVRERLRLVGELLRLDLSATSDQAALSLALTVHEHHGPGAFQDAGGPVQRPVALEDLLVTQEASHWADSLLGPLTKGPSAALRETVRVWVGHDGCVASTAASLGLSVSATRKRLLRAGLVTGRPILDLPGVRHDLWLAFTVLDRGPASRPLAALKVS